MLRAVINIPLNADILYLNVNTDDLTTKCSNTQQKFKHLSYSFVYFCIWSFFTQGFMYRK